MQPTSQSNTVLLYSTVGCHLCEEAEAMYHYLLQQPMVDRHQIPDIKSIDIIQHPDLLERYGVRIPVFVYQQQELGWPFEPDELLEWLLSI